ncbi:O-antigen ligase family protein [Alteromonas macleodii]|uniref:O-antigen ligase family protein n=1 Tax=Alteromonas macleodii TaxID=28108 RepID=UPI001930CCA3|nr:O-antigen ligase family protein [Alteromonas macleodii]
MISSSKLFAFYVFTLLVVPFYIGPEIATNFQINLERLALVLITFYVFFKLLKTRTYFAIGDMYKKNKVFLLFFSLFFLWRFFTAISSEYIVSIFLFLYELISNFLVFFAFYLFVFSKGNSEKFLKVVYFSIYFVFAFSILEFVLGKNIFATLAPANSGAAISSEAIVRGSVYRVKSVFEHPLTLGHFCVMVLPLTLFIKGYASSNFRKNNLLSLFVIAMAGLTGSRMTLLCCTLILIIYFLTNTTKIRFLEGAKPTKISTFIWPFLVILPFLALMSISILSGRDSLDSYVRHAQIINGLQVISMEPIFGFGQGPGGMLAIAKYGTAMKLWAQNAHTIDNWFLSILMASGYPGLLLFIVLNVLVFINLKKIFIGRERYKAISPSVYSLWLAFSISYVFGLLFMGILSIFTLHPLFYILLAGLLWATAELKKLKWEYNAK